MAEIAEVIKIQIASELTQNVDEENQVVVHCMFPAVNEENGLRIWPTTFLICRQTRVRVGLVHQENITMYPNWTWVPENTSYFFTLFFRGLPKGCRTFDLIEEIPQSGGFVVRNIVRNNSDVYKVALG